MSGYIQIAGDPTQWWLVQPLQASQLTGQPMSVQVQAPLAGTLLLSPNCASVAVFDPPNESAPARKFGVSFPVIYLPTAAGPSAGSAGYELPASADLVSLASEITAVMHSGGRQTVALGGSGGALVLNGAELSFAVLCPVPKAPPVVPTGPVVTSSMPHDTQVGGPGRTTPAS